MSGSGPWQSVLAAPAPRQHIAQLYTEPGFLARAVGDFVAGGFRAGDAVIILAIPSSWQAIGRRLADQRFDLAALQRRGQLTVLDAASCLARLLVDGMPDPERFRSVIGGAVEAAGRAGYRRIRVFSELVDLLRRTDLAAIIRLEELWNDLLAVHSSAATPRMPSNPASTTDSCRASARYTPISSQSRTTRASSERSSAPTWTCSGPPATPAPFAACS
jgi:hypothetical protein